MNKLTLEQAKTWRTILRIAFFLVSFVAPSLIIAFKFHLFTTTTAVSAKWSITAIVLILIVGWRFKKRIVEWINSWDNDNIFKWILYAIGKVWPFALVVAVIALIYYSASELLSDVLFCMEWACGCELFSYLFIYPIEMRMHYRVERLIRKEERKEDIKEAYNEIMGI